MSTTTSGRVALRRCLATVAAVTIGLGGALVGTTVASAADSPAIPVDTSNFDDGRYVVLLEDDAAALYTGGVANLQRTSPVGTDSLDTDAPAVVAYSDYLVTEQEAVAASVGADVAASLTITSNGFIADLSADQALDLLTDPRVAGVYPDEILQLQGSPSNDYLDVEGMWEQVGGEADAGTGVVVGVLDTGIAPENPLFAGEALGTTAGTEPYLNADGEIVFVKGDGGTFTGTCETGPQFDATDCSTKIVGAQFFLDGFGASRIGGEGVETASPRDLDGHGSHTASTAAGNFDVPVTTEGGLDIGTMSGVAPEARIAVYKVCWSGTNPDPAVTTDDGCSGTDLMQGIEAAVDDGVDVINFSIGGGAAESVFEPYDQAFLAAAEAGVFTSASAGNSGPNPTTLDHASPWYTTVANTTIENYEATVTYEDGSAVPGASVTIDPALEPPLSGTLVYAGDIPLAPATAADAALCLPGSIDPAAAEGLIVLCDRGSNARAEKSVVVEAAGGIGMILGNPTPQSVDLDDHAVPTVHIDAPYYPQALAAAQAGETVTFTYGNTTEITTPAPVVAASSSRGPVIADGNDVIKPDIAAPGTGIIAAGPNGEGEDPSFIFLSGTSMAAPHVAGLAAVYLGEHPLATPAEIKSALMTTATDTVNADGTPNQDWFAQGAGFVNTAAFLDAGVYYANDRDDWYGYLRGIGYELPSDWIGASIDPSDLNIPSIGIGSLTSTQTITRTLTALEPGSYDVSVDAPEGVTTTVSPTTLDFTEVGQELSYTVQFDVLPTTATEAWTTGSLTWTSAEHTARSPIAVYPASVAAPEWIDGTGVTGTAPVTVRSGITGSIDLGTAGLYPYAEIFSGEEAVGDTGQSPFFTVAEGELARHFSLDAANDADDLDLTIGRVVDNRIVESYAAATGAADETLLIEDPTPGQWVALVDVYSAASGSSAFTLDASTVVPGAGEGDLATSPTTLAVTAAEDSSYEVSWRNLPVDEAFFGVVTYSTTDDVRTYVRVTTGAATIPAPERIAGADRFETSIAASELGYPDGADVVYVASGVNYPDGLAAGPAAAYEGGPLLLTRPETLPASIADEIERLSPSRVVIVGGEPSVSAAVEAAVGDIASVETVDRLGGADRFETSRLIAEYAFDEGAGTAFLATGRNFPDALTAGAAAGSMDAPVILVDGELANLDAATLSTLQDLGVSQSLVAGSAAAVSEGIYRDLINNLMNPYRAAGADRFLTGVYINQAVFGSADEMFVASGLKFPDALSASALAGAWDAPLYVVRPECVPSELISESLRLGQPDVYFMGDESSLGAGAESYAVCG